jgi:hypothetical protein
VDENPLLGRDDERRFFNQVTGHYDAPAYVRRARQVEEALIQLVERCRRQRGDWLEVARIQLGMLRQLAGDWSALRPLVTDDRQVELLRGLYTELDPRPRLPVEPTGSAGKLRRALREIVASVERFNRRWQGFLAGVDLGAVNALRAGYNRYYVLEKECAVRSPRLARQGFTPLEPLTVAELTTLLPPLPVPQLRE